MASRRGTARPLRDAVLPALARSGCRRSAIRLAGGLLGGSQTVVHRDARNIALVYTVLANVEPFGAVATKLGFRPLANPIVEVGGQRLYSVLLDMGPGSVDAWLTEMVGAEITAEEIQSSKVLDVDAHELTLTSGRVGLTSLEFGVMQYLQERPLETQSAVTTSWKRYGGTEAQRRATSSMSWSALCDGSLAPKRTASRRCAAPDIGTASRHIKHDRSGASLASMTLCAIRQTVIHGRRR
jgi:hypothetical protein